MKITIISKENCTECERIKVAMKNQQIDFTEEKMETLPQPKQFELRNTARRNRQASMPLLFVDGNFMTTPLFESNILKGGK